MSGITTDTHFGARDRMGRLATFLARIINDGWRSAPLGVGIDERTGTLRQRTPGPFGERCSLGYSRRMRRSAIRLFVLVVFISACGDDDGASADANPNAPDALSVETLCPPTDDLRCESATQVCVVAGPFGPTNTSSCEAIPRGCEADRSCACLAATLCNPTDTCTDTAGNTIYCDNGSQ